MDPESTTIPKRAPSQQRSTPVDPPTPPALKIATPPQLTVNRPRFRLAGTLALIVALLVVMTWGIAHALEASRDKNVGKATPTAPTVATTRPGTTPTANTTTPPTNALSVKGTQIVDTAGKVVTLIGATRSSLEYANANENNCTGDGHFEVADFRSMHDWGMNTVRIPVWSYRWLNLGADCPPTYQQTVQKAVTNAEAAGLYVIIDLHWMGNSSTQSVYTNPDGTPNFQYPMPDATNDVKFWQQVATRYKDDPNVIFELIGEPHLEMYNDYNGDLRAWNVWLNGGTIATRVGSYQAIGMKDLVAKVRAIAPKNLIIASGLNWGYDLSKIPAGYAIDAPNIIYGTHPFDGVGKPPTQWPTSFGTTARSYSVIATEFGQYDCGTAYNQQAVQYFAQLQISWLAWGWGVPPNTAYCDATLRKGPYLLADWYGTPNAYGQFIKQKMLAAHNANG